MRRRVAIVVTAATLPMVCACGSQPPSSTTTPPPVAVDHCVVGSWKSTGIRGTLTVATAPVTLSGGAGELLTIASSGRLRTDDSSTAPLTGTAADGSVYTVTQTGTATGTVTAQGGHLAVTLDQPTPLTVTLTRNGTVVQSRHPGSATDSYTCSAGSSLVITGSGGTVSTYAPA